MDTEDALNPQMAETKIGPVLGRKLLVSDQTTNIFEPKNKGSEKAHITCMTKSFSMIEVS